MDPSGPISPLSAGIGWAYRITSVSLEFVLPTVGGYYLDRSLGTSPTFTLAGAVLGLLVGFVHLIQLARQASSPGSKP